MTNTQDSTTLFALGMQCISYSGYGDPAKQDKAKKKPEVKPKMSLLDPTDIKKKDPKKKSQGEKLPHW